MGMQAPFGAVFQASIGCRFPSHSPPHILNSRIRTVEPQLLIRGRLLRAGPITLGNTFRRIAFLAAPPWQVPMPVALPPHGMCLGGTGGVRRLAMGVGGRRVPPAGRCCNVVAKPKLRPQESIYECVFVSFCLGTGRAFYVLCSGGRLGRRSGLWRGALAAHGRSCHKPRRPLPRRPTGAARMRRCFISRR